MKSTPKSEGKSLPWFRLDVAFVDHPRVFALQQALERDELLQVGSSALAGWYVVRLFAYTMRFHPSGRVDGAETARAGRVDGAETARVTERNETERNGTEEADPQPPMFDVTSPLVDLAEAEPEEVARAIEAFDAPAFWRWSEDLRRRAGWAPEKWPSPLLLRKWWVEARHGARPVSQLLDAWVVFAKDAHWRAATPPAPFAAFAKNWNKYLRAERK